MVTTQASVRPTARTGSGGQELEASANTAVAAESVHIQEVLYPDPPTDFLEAVSSAYVTYVERGITVFKASYDRYERRFGPGAWGRDHKLIQTGLNLVLAYNLDPNWGPDGPSISTDEMEKRLVEAYDKEGRIPPDEDPFWREVALRTPPRPKNKDLDGLYHSLSRPVAQKLWSEWDGPQTEVEPAYEPKLISLRATRDLTTADEDFVISGGVLTKKAKLLLHASSGTGKTTLLDHIAASLASGTRLLGLHEVDRPHRVLFVQGELSGPEIGSHGQDLLANFEGTPAEDNLAFWQMTQMYLPEGVGQLRAAIQAHRADILIIDPFNRFFAGDNSTQPEQVNLLFRCLDAINEDEELGMSAVIVAHHTNVSGARASGSYVFEAWPSTILRLDIVPGQPTKRKLLYEKIRAPGSTLLNTAVLIELTDDGYLAVEGTGTDVPFAGPFLVTEVLREMAGQGYRRELLDRVCAKANVKARTAQTYIKNAVDQKLVRQLARDAHGTVYQLIGDNHGEE